MNPRRCLVWLAIYLLGSAALLFPVGWFAKTFIADPLLSGLFGVLIGLVYVVVMVPVWLYKSYDAG